MAKRGPPGLYPSVNRGSAESTTRKVGSMAAALRFRAWCSREVPAMAGPGDEIAAGSGGRGHLRASHADREQVIGTLKAAFVQGRLVKDEFDLRVGEALALRTYAELAALTADLPAGPAGAASSPRAARAQDRRPVGNVARAGICVVMAVAAPVVLSFSIGPAAFLLFTPFYFMALAVLG